MNPKPEKEMLLSGLQVLDLADEKAGFCTEVLAGLGAKVIKVEPLGTENGNETFLRLAKGCDVIVETFPPGHLEERGLGFNTLTGINPGTILASVTGFGQHGPRRDYKSCDLVAAALGGQMYVCGSPSDTPLKIFGEQSYYIASLYAVIGILLALQNRRQTGKGEHIDISLQDAVTSTLEHVMVQYFYEHTVAKRQEDLHWNNAFCILPCNDGFIHLTLFQQWETLIEWMAGEGKAGDLLDSKWNDEDYRKNHPDHIIDVLQEWTKHHEVGELFEMGQLMHFPWAPVQTPQEVLDSPQLKARGFFDHMEHRELNTGVPCPGLPYKLITSKSSPPKQAPLTGEDSVRKKAPIKGGILKGIRVLDFTRVLAGPYATRILADSGAEVIKVQSKKTATGAESNESGYFNTWNRNKKSITLDMSFPEARDIALKLIAISDVVIENFSPRVMANWGLDYESLKKNKPNLIMVSMSAMGQTGPWKDFVAFGPTIQSLGALTYLTSYDRQSPMGPGYSYADTVAGLYGALAVLAGLGYKNRTGQGMFVDLSEYEAVCTLNGPLFLDLFADSKTVLPAGNRSDSVPAAPYGCYKCAGTDRWCAIAVFNDEEWHNLCHVMGQPDWSIGEKFSTASKRKERSRELDQLIGKWTSKHTSETVMHLLQEQGVPAGIVQNAEDLANDPQLKARNFFIHLEHPVFGDTISDGLPIKFRNTPMNPWKSAPLLGEDNPYVYMELLGLSEKEMASYMKKGVIG